MKKISLMGMLFALVLILTTGCLQSKMIPEDETEEEYPSYLAPTLLDGTSQNPIISHVYTADPTARVFENRVYVYASHDLDTQTNYDMVDYHIFSSDDLVNWQDHGIGLHAKDLSWAGLLYAPDCVYNEADGKYYLYFPNGGSNIGVAVSDKPEGPFVDAVGGPLVNRGYPNCNVPWLFDPNVLIDDDGQAYLYFGGGMPGTGDNARVIRLNDDLISLKDEEATTIVAPDFFEAAFTYKRNNKYYFTYSTNWENGHGIRIDYMMSDNPMTGFEYKGVVIDNPPRNQGNNNHHSIVEYQGETYVFYHNRKLAMAEGNNSGYQRSISFDRLGFDADGLIEQAALTDGTVKQLKNVDAFSRIEAELIAVQNGVEVDDIYENGVKTGASLSNLDHGDWVGVSQVDFGNGATSFTANISSNISQAQIEIWIDGGADNGGTMLGICNIPNTEGSENWEETSSAIESVQGVHDVYLIFKGNKTKENMFLFDYYRFE